MKKPNDHAEPTKVDAKKKKRKDDNQTSTKAAWTSE